MDKDLFVISPKDNVGTSLKDNFKYALRDIKTGELVVKYGYPIGKATRDMKADDLIHTHNIKTLLNGAESLSQSGNKAEVRGRISGTKKDTKAVIGGNKIGFQETQTAVQRPRIFQGYVRKNGTVGIRDDIFVIPTVGCVNGLCERIAAACRPKTDVAIQVLSHPYGCSQLGGDHENTRNILKNLALHPNAGGVLIVALGCENNTLEGFKKLLGDYDPERIRFVKAQDSGDELAEGIKQTEELLKLALADKRSSVNIDKLVIGLKCGGSDALSGITANPLAGRISDRLTLAGGSVVMTEVPEMFGAEHILMSRAADKKIHRKIGDMVNGFKDYFVSHGESVAENPSPGNKAGGITTLEEKSLGCIQKGGSAPVRGVLPYGGTVYGAVVRKAGLILLEGPGNDIVSCTALAAAGAHLVLFTTGRGTPLGGPAPVIKISSNTALANRKPGWIDFDAGTLTGKNDPEETAGKLFDLIIETASGQRTRSERNGYFDFAIWKGGVTL